MIDLLLVQQRNGGRIETDLFDERSVSGSISGEKIETDPSDDTSVVDAIVGG